MKVLFFVMTLLFNTSQLANAEATDDGLKVISQLGNQQNPSKPSALVLQNFFGDESGALTKKASTNKKKQKR